MFSQFIGASQYSTIVPGGQSHQAAICTTGCTGELQPLYVSVNDMFKKKLKNSFSSLYAEQVSSDLSTGK